LLVLPVFAQDATPPAPASDVTYDQVNQVAGKMYCPECENIPLDKCGSAVCLQWKGEIADQLASGRTEQQIIDGFVARFGDQVLGIPQDTTLRNISLIAPYLLAGIALIVGIITFLRWRGNHPEVTPVQSLAQSSETDDYRARIEHDLEL
jgi:cytochrome c-type biogenesis protein CcmH